MSISSPRQQSRHLPAFLLLALARNPMHGGALLAAVNRDLPKLKTDSAAVYRALKNLEKDGDIEGGWDTSGVGPAIRIYRLTASGWDRLDFWLADIKDRIANLSYFVESHGRLKRPKHM